MPNNDCSSLVWISWLIGKNLGGPCTCVEKRARFRKNTCLALDRPDVISDCALSKFSITPNPLGSYAVRQIKPSNCGSQFFIAHHDFVQLRTLSFSRFHYPFTVIRNSHLLVTFGDLIATFILFTNFSNFCFPVFLLKPKPPFHEVLRFSLLVC